MALVWAKQNGNWSDTTLWAFWNESTQQIEDYNQTPLADDVVYCNGHTINIVSGTYIISQIRNDVNPYTNIGGGFCKGPTTNSTIIFNAEIHSISKILSLSEQSSLGCYFTLIGDIYCRNEYAIHIGTNSGRCTINGNIYGNYAADVQWNPTLILNGNIYSENSALPIFYIRSLGGGSNAGSVTLNCNINDIFVFEINAQFRSLKINGNVTEDNYRIVDPTSNIISTLSISGDYTNKREQYYIVTDFIIGGSIYYIGTNNRLGVRYTNITILNPNTFVWKDVAEPRLNPFIILTDAEMNNRQQYPAENEVKEGTEYVWGQKLGTYQQPPESVVLKGYVYDNGDKIGSLENQNIVGCVTKEDVREGVELIGLQEVGTLVVPSVDDVREGVVFDNGSVGTLIVQGGGDRLRIADFGYYTRSTSITYIVDLTESDKPAFADCERIVLLSLFPTLDLDNIPDKFFDDLFVQFLRYRLLVEYYRGTSINSKFTPSEPAAEIVNYANTKCEYWLNTANLFLQLWGEKYPNSVKKDRILL